MFILYYVKWFLINESIIFYIGKILFNSVSLNALFVWIEHKVYSIIDSKGI